MQVKYSECAGNIHNQEKKKKKYRAPANLLIQFLTVIVASDRIFATMGHVI